MRIAVLGTGGVGATLAGAQVTFRPSGTEPKLKLYVEVEGTRLGAATRAEADALGIRGTL